MGKLDNEALGEVNQKTLHSLTKCKLVELVIENLSKYKKLSVLKEQTDKALQFIRNHMIYRKYTRSNVLERCFDLLYRKTFLKESFERVKNATMMLQVELSQYTLFSLSDDPTKSIETNMGTF